MAAELRRADARSAAAARAPWGLWALLTLIVCGLFAPDRGLYQDDASVLAIVKEAWRTDGLRGVFAPMGAPTRRLLGSPSFLAWLTPEPALALQLFYGLTWLLVAWAAWRLAREMFPDAPRAAWIAGTLTACATGDFLTGSPVALGYQVCVLLALLALASALRFVRRGSWRSLAAGALLAAASVFTIDGAAVALALAPLLFLASGESRARAGAATAAWGAALLPYAVLMADALKSAGSYVSLAAAPLAPLERLRLTALLSWNDFFPPAWPLSRVPFGDAPPRVIPVWFWTAAAIFAVFLVLRALARVDGGPSPGRHERRDGRLAAWCVLAAVATHAAYAGVAFAPYFYRTQVLSRVLVSTALALVLDRLLARAGGARAAALVAVGAFVGFGTAGGMERQDLYLSTWRRHRIELASLVDAAPRVRPGTTLLLFVPHDPSYQATEAPYLARRWSELLWADPSTRPRVFLWSADAWTACVAGSEGFRCRLPEEKECFETGACAGTRLPWDETVLLTWHPAEGRFHLEKEIPPALLAGVPAPGAAYRPHARILAGSPDPSARAFLHGDVGLGRLFR